MGVIQTRDRNADMELLLECGIVPHEIKRTNEALMVLEVLSQLKVMAAALCEIQKRLAKIEKGMGV